MAADTSSAPAGAIPIVDGSAAEVVSFIASPIPLKSADAAATASGAAIRKDDNLGSNHLRGEANQGQSSDTDQNCTQTGLSRLAFRSKFRNFIRRTPDCRWPPMFKDAATYNAMRGIRNAWNS